MQTDRCTQGEKGIRFKKYGHKNVIKHEKTGPPRFSDNLKDPPQKIWPKPEFSSTVIYVADIKLYCKILLLQFSHC